jgi:Cu(I)/Ag(I) efflux system membrane protein CusA/SilA
MINWLIDVSLRNRVLVIAAFLLLGGWGYWALLTTPIDAIPDLSDNQVIVFTDWPGRSPKEVEDQVTYPLTVSLQGLAGVRVVRSSSAFGFSMINVIFEDAVDLYFARARVLERLNLVSKSLPPDVVPTLGPDATGVGHVFGTRSRGPGSRSATCGPSRTGSSATSSTRYPGWPRSRVSAGSSASTRLTSIRIGCARTASPCPPSWTP